MIVNVPLRNDLEKELPFESYFNFSRLREYFLQEGAKKGYESIPEWQEKLRFFDEAPLYERIVDESIILDYEENLKELVFPIFSELLQTNEIKTITLPYSDQYIFPTVRLQNILAAADEKKGLNVRVPKEDMFYIQACLFILGFYYGINTKMTRPFFLDVPLKNGKTTILRMFINADFCEFTPKPEFKGLSQEDIALLLKNPEDIDLWKEMIPPKSFVMEGFTIVNMFDVTMDETLDRLKSFLLKRSALDQRKSRELITEAISIFLGDDNFKVGLTHYDSSSMKLSQHRGQGWKSYMVHGNDSTYMKSACGMNSSEDLFGGRAYATWQIGDELPEEAPEFMSFLQNKGYKSLIFIPLIYGSETIGILELMSKDKDVISPITYTMVEPLLPILALALFSYKENHQTELEAVIQQNYTSLHPSISWRFMEAAEEYVSNKAKDVDIVFKNVYPLFGQSDIKSSSSIRNSAIQSDIITQLRAAKKVLEKAVSINALPVFRQMQYEIEHHQSGLKKELLAGDELTLMDFMNQQLNPIFDWMRQETAYSDVMRSYDRLLDPELGIVYDKRGKFEDSVAMINERLADYFMDRQDEAQKFFPHYCEFYKTDGVEYNLYLGQSIQPNRSFHEFHLKNLRLWQLMTSCEQENLFKELKSELPMDLDIRTLILCHDNPMSIKFRVDEKKFDVDGAYNIRYEIVKKRIDKAIVRGNGERLTKTDHLTVVFSQEKEKLEYLEYFEYLQSIEYLKSGVEVLQLEDMPGASGLQALRAPISFKSLVSEVPKSTAILSKVS